MDHSLISKRDSTPPNMHSASFNMSLHWKMAIKARPNESNLFYPIMTHLSSAVVVVVV